MEKGILPRLAQIRDLWLQRPSDKRTRNDVLAFYGELQQNHPDLLRHGHGDPYHHLQVELTPWIRE